MGRRETYTFAGRIVGVTSLYGEVHDYCRDYRAEGAPDFEVSTTREDIRFEREKSAREDLCAGRALRRFPDWYLEELAVYRKIAERMPYYDTFLFHGSAIAVDGVGYLFTAKSGTGKSTHTRLWREMLGGEAAMVNDDKPYVRIGAEGITVYGSPYDGKHHLGANTAVPLKAVCFLSRAAENTAARTDFREMLPRLIESTYLPDTREETFRALQLLEEIGRRAEFYRIACNMEPEAAETAFRAIYGNRGA